MFRRERDRFSDEESTRLALFKKSRGIVHPRCVANNVYKSWHPADEKEGSASDSQLAGNEHPSWLARLRFSFFHRWSEK